MYSPFLPEKTGHLDANLMPKAAISHSTNAPGLSHA